MKSFFKKLSDFFIKIFEKILNLFKRIFTSRFFKRIGSFFKAIPSKAGLIPVFLRKISNYPPLSWVKKNTLPVWRFVSKYLNIALTFSINLLGKLRLGQSILAWDSVALTFYLILNFIIVSHILFRAFKIKDYSKKYAVPLILLSIPAGIAIHTVTAFLYNGIAARPFWNSAILAPKFLASAFCSGPAIMIILFQVLRKTTRIRCMKGLIP